MRGLRVPGSFAFLMIMRGFVKKSVTKPLMIMGKGRREWELESG